jgi:hypothetical protein
MTTRKTYRIQAILGDASRNVEVRLKRVLNMSEMTARIFDNDPVPLCRIDFVPGGPRTSHAVPAKI